MAVSDKPMTYEQFQAIKAQVTKELLLTPREWLTLLAPNLDSTGAAQLLLNTSGQVTEASAAGILADTTNIETYTLVAPYYLAGPRFTTNSHSTTAHGQAAQFKRLSVTLTATAGGEIVSAAVAPSITGYKTCMVITGFWSDQTDGSINLAWATTSGLTYGPATTNIATTASTFTPNWYEGIAWKGSAVTEAINVSAAAGQCAANQVIQVIGYYWGEAT